MRAIPLLLAGLIALPVTAGAENKDLAVMPLSARRVPQETVAILDELLATEIDQLGTGYQVLGIRDIESMLGFEKMKDALGCDDISCAAEIGGALGVGRLLAGSVSKLGDEIIVQLTLLDAREGKVLKRGRATVQDDENLYRHAIRKAAADVMGVKIADPTPQPAPTPTPKPKPAMRTGPNISPVRYAFQTPEASLEFTISIMGPDGFSHSCDKPLTASSPCLIGGMAKGDGHLRVTSEGLGPFSRGLEVDEDDETLVFTVIERPSTGSVLMWTFGGIALATGAALIGVGAGVDIKPMLYAGVPTAVVGAGLLTWGFYFDGRVHVNYPFWGMLF